MLLKASKTTLVFLLCFGFAIASGCKSMEFGKPKLPSLPSLAFWKKGVDSEIPPPPARHFDPSRFGGEVDAQLAEAKSDSADFDRYGMRIKDSAKEAGELASKGFKFPKESIEKLNSKPTRKLYGMDDLDDDKMLAEAQNKFNLDSTNLKNKFENAKSGATDQLSGAQQDFRSAMNSAANAGSSTKDAVAKGSNSFTSGDNSFAAVPMAKAADTLKDLGKVSGGSFLPETDSFNNVAKASAAGKASLYDARGQLKSATSNVGGQAKDFASANVDSMKSKFEQRLLAAQKKAQEQVQTKSEAFKSGALKANDQINAFANVSPQTQDTFNQPFPKIAADGSFIPPSPKRPVDLNANQMALQPRSNSLLPINKPNALSPNSFAGASNGSVSQMGSEVEEYKRQIASLKAQVAAANRSSAPATPSLRQPSSYPVAQNTIEGVVLPLDKVNNAFDSRAGNPVANQIQSQPYSPAATNPYTPAPHRATASTLGEVQIRSIRQHLTAVSVAQHNPNQVLATLALIPPTNSRIKFRKPVITSQAVFTQAR